MEVPRPSRTLLHRDHYRYGVIAALLVLISTPIAVGAHGAGAFFETEVGNYILDIGFSSPAPQTDESVIFDFQLRNSGTTLISGSDAAYTDVWVRIEGENGTVFASGIHNAEFGGPRMSYVFPKEGTYTISARYEHGNDTLAETSFPMTVVPAPGTFFWERIPHGELYLGVGIGAVLVGLLGLGVVLRNKKVLRS